ncbi:MAG: hypothetical protein H6625_02075 [Bdellovibrionaceae bacterium]|nr:hypothetical protein [Pseudobdellovibrionaceae bacterium]
MKKTNWTILLAIISLSLLGGAQKYLSGEEIKSAFTDKTGTSVHMIKKTTGIWYHAKDGKFLGKGQDSKKIVGTWYVQKNKFCTKTNKVVCTFIEADGQGGYYRVDDKSKKLVHIKKLVSGNSIK